MELTQKEKQARIREVGKCDLEFAARCEKLGWTLVRHRVVWSNGAANQHGTVIKSTLPKVSGGNFWVAGRDGRVNLAHWRGDEQRFAFSNFYSDDRGCPTASVTAWKPCELPDYPF